jgi:hypothetical protein
VVEKSALVGQPLPKEAESGKDTVECIASGDETALVSNTESRKAEARRGNTGGDSSVGIVNITAVLDHPRFGVALFPEKKKTRHLQVVKKLIVFGR